MSDLQAVGRARMHLAQAITRSCAGEDDVAEHLTAAAESLRNMGLTATADLVEDLRDEECRRCDFRYDLRQLAQTLDAWASSSLERYDDACASASACVWRRRRDGSALPGVCPRSEWRRRRDRDGSEGDVAV